MHLSQIKFSMFILICGTFFQVIEYLVGDGPNNRYALICHQCCSHNGMALKEEFEYTGTGWLTPCILFFVKLF